MPRAARLGAVIVSAVAASLWRRGGSPSEAAPNRLSLLVRVTLAAWIVTATAFMLFVTATSPARADAWVRYEAEGSDSQITRSGGSAQTVTGASGGSVWMETVDGNYVQVTCPSTSTGVRAYVRTASTQGIVSITYDGSGDGTFDEYSTTGAVPVLAVSHTGLSSGAHTLRLTRSGTRNALSSGFGTNVDYFECLDTSVTTTTSTSTTTTSTTIAPTTTSTTSAPTTTTTALPVVLTYPCADYTDRSSGTTTSTSTTTGSTTTSPSTTTTADVPCAPCGYTTSKPCTVALGSFNATALSLSILGYMSGAGFGLVLLYLLRYVKGV